MARSPDTPTESTSAPAGTHANADVDVEVDVATAASVRLLPVYRGEITVRLGRLPALQPLVLPTRADNRWRRFLQAGRRRRFTLVDDFEISIEGSVIPRRLEGTLVIPRRVPHDDDRPDAGATDNIFDGASIPLPWIVSYLSFGVLRPLGILLTASVVHDFTYQFGFLPVRRAEGVRRVPIERSEADELFRQITATLNRSRVFSRLAWHAVRLGWWALPYAGRRFAGKPPIRSTILAIAASFAGVLIGQSIRRTWLSDVSGLAVPAAMLGGAVAAIGAVYLVIAVEQRRLDRKQG